jgi:hypothetical protein
VSPSQAAPPAELRLIPVDPPCTECGQRPGIHSGEPHTTRLADGVVQDKPVKRCTECHVAGRTVTA